MTGWFQQAPFAVRALLVVLRMAAMVYVGLMVYLAVFQRRVMYYPERATESELVTVAQRHGMEPWRNAEGEIMGWRPRLTDPSLPRDRILAFHGNAGFALHRTYLVEGFGQRLSPPDFAVYLVEYPGYGARSGSPSEAAFYAAAEEAFLALRREAPGSRIFLLGESLGSAVAARLAGQHPASVSGVFMMTAFNRMADVARHHYPVMPVSLLLRDRYETAVHLAAYRGPVAILLAGHDNVVPTRFGQKLYESYNGPKQLWLQDNRNHNTLDVGPYEPWWKEVRDFLNRYALPPPMPI